MISQKQITNLIMISGGAQFLAIDDGSNSDYSEVGGAGFPVILASPLDYWGRPNGISPFFPLFCFFVKISKEVPTVKDAKATRGISMSSLRLCMSLTPLTPHLFASLLMLTVRVVLL